MSIQAVNVSQMKAANCCLQNEKEYQKILTSALIYSQMACQNNTEAFWG